MAPGIVVSPLRRASEIASPTRSAPADIVRANRSSSSRLAAPALVEADTRVIIGAPSVGIYAPPLSIQIGPQPLYTPYYYPPPPPIYYPGPAYYYGPRYYYPPVYRYHRDYYRNYYRDRGFHRGHDHDD